MRGRNSGFSLVEVSFVVMLMIAGSSVAVVQLKSSVTSLDANVAANLVTDQLRYARDIAVNQRRNVRVEFNSPDTIVIKREEVDDTLTVISTTTLPSGYSFGLPSDDIGDTPESFGNDDPVDFNSSNTGTFLGDGTFVGGSGVVMSGTVFTINSGNGSARAVTLSGATGRTKLYYIRDGSWVEKL